MLAHGLNECLHNFGHWIDCSEAELLGVNEIAALHTLWKVFFQIVLFASAQLSRLSGILCAH